MITPNLLFWGYAYALTLVALAIALQAVGLARKGHLAAHGKRMDIAILLILIFVASYVLKVIFLGREEKQNWETFHFVVLYIHESFIALMLIGGTVARVLASKFKQSVYGNQTPTALDLKRRGTHRFFGKLCLVSTGMALVTASFILYTLYTVG